MCNVDREGVVTSAELFHEWNGMNGGMDTRQSQRKWIGQEVGVVMDVTKSQNDKNK